MRVVVNRAEPLVTLLCFLFSSSCRLTSGFVMNPTAPTGLSIMRKRVVPTRKTYRPPPSLAFGQCLKPFCKECPPPDFQFCAVIADSSDSASESGSEASFEVEPVKSGLFGIQQRNWSVAAVKDNLLKISNWASLLCVLDCTILPLVTIILPLFGIVAASPAQMEWLHELGHQMALYFVMPVGGLATTVNYTNHRKFWITAIGWLGLVAVLSANAGCHFTHGIHGPVGHFLHKWLHVLHHGVIHRVTNLAGCAMLITSNYLSHKAKGGCKEPGCTVKH
jgi:hypothetical protein